MLHDQVYGMFQRHGGEEPGNPPDTTFTAGEPPVTSGESGTQPAKRTRVSGKTTPSTSGRREVSDLVLHRLLREKSNSSSSRKGLHPRTICPLDFLEPLSYVLECCSCSVDRGEPGTMHSSKMSGFILLRRERSPNVLTRRFLYFALINICIPFPSCKYRTA